MTRIFTMAGSRLQEVLEELKAIRLAFLWVELCPENLALPDNGRYAAIARGGCKHGFFYSGEIVTMDEIKIATGWHILQERASALVFDGIPTHMGNAFFRCCFF